MKTHAIRHLSVFAVVLAVLSACGSSDGTASDAREAAPFSSAGGATNKDSPHEHPPTEVTSCSQLLEEGWTAPEADPNIDYDPTTRIAILSFGEHNEYTFDLGTDPDCEKLPDVGQFLARTHSDFEEARDEECRHTVDSLNRGIPVERDGITADPGALRTLVQEWCPPRFAEELEK